MKKTYIVIISCLVVIVLALIGFCVFLSLKNEHLEDLNDRYIDNTLNNNTSDNINNDTNSDNQDSKITSDEALQVVLDDLKIKKEDIYDLDIELEYKYGSEVYEIDFKYNKYEYDYYIDSKTKKIVKSFKELDY